MSAPIPILMYHAVAEYPSATTRRLSVRPRMLESHLALLRDQGFTTVTFAHLAAAMQGDQSLPERPIVLTFDDGYADFHREALPLLTSYGCVATLFVTTGWIADAGRDRAGKPLDRALSWAQIDEVASTAIEIGAHSHSHAQLDQLSDVAVRWELVKSKILLENRLRREVTSLAYPYGYFSPRVRAAAQEAGYKQAATVSNARTERPADRFALPRLTIRRATRIGIFERIIHCRDLPRIYMLDRSLGTAYTVVRRGRYLARNLGDHA